MKRFVAVCFLCVCCGVGCGDDSSRGSLQDVGVNDVSSGEDSGSVDVGYDSSPDATVDAQPDTEIDAETLSFADQNLQETLANLEVPQVPLEPVEAQDPARVALGRALFFDPILSGNRDVACSTCHVPSLGTSDGLVLSSGTTLFENGTSTERRARVPRHAIELFGRGNPLWRDLFWDGRVARTPDGVLRTPLGDRLPDGVSDVLAAQAIFPLLDRAEMLGQPGDRAFDGTINEIANLSDDDPGAILEAYVARLREIPEYVQLFADAFPSQTPQQWTMREVVQALAAYQRDAFRLKETPWDRYLRGDLSALTDTQKIGAAVFFTTAGCGSCHSGTLFTDQQYHVTGVAQLGPGVPGFEPFDPGRFAVTGDDADRFAFRTTPLRNVELTAPYMHNGSIATLERVLAHYGRPQNAALREELEMLPEPLRATIRRDPEHVEDLNTRISPRIPEGVGATVGLSNVREFLKSLTSDDLASLRDLEPTEVPSGLPPGGAVIEGP